MEKKFDIVFNSEKENGENCFQIASGYISETTILFEKENTIAVIHAKGHIELYNMEGELLSAGELPPVEGGKGVYQEVCCQVVNNSIILKFPTYEWVDNYPHCDGEHDRWETKKIGYNTITFDLAINQVK